MLIKGPVPTPYTIVQRSFRLTFRKRRMVRSLLLFISRLRCTHTPCLSIWLHSCFYYHNNCSFHRILITEIKCKPFPKLFHSILSSEQCETSCRYWHKSKLEGAMYSPNPGFRKSIPRVISFPCPQETKSSHSSNVIVIIALQRDK